MDNIIEGVSPEEYGIYLQALTVLALTVSWSLTSIFIVAVATATILRLSAPQLIPGLNLAQFWKCLVGLLEEIEKKIAKVKQPQRMSDQRKSITQILLFGGSPKGSKSDQITGVEHRTTHCCADLLSTQPVSV